MRQKFFVVRGDSKAEIVIREMSELEKNEFSLVRERSYNTAELKKSAVAGTDEMIKTLRSTSFYPPYHIAKKITAAVKTVLNNSGDDSVEVLIDDLEASREAEAEAAIEEEGHDGNDIDELLEDDDEDDS